MNYVNEFDAYPAQWSRNLAAAGEIAPCIVDERSIWDVCAADLVDYDQCHFFGGISVWPAALRRAGVPDDFPVWTGSCPCQGFSVAGQGRGFADERHAWPAWFHLIDQRRPPVIFGEQVASPLAGAWLDLVCADLEAIGYAVGTTVAPAAGFGAPHGRHRTWFVAHALRPGWSEWWAFARSGSFTGGGFAGELADDDDERLEGRRRVPERRDERAAGARGVGGAVSVVDAESQQARVSRFARERRATRGFWEDADWIACRGGKWRPIEPGTFPLAHGAANRVGKLRAYGNAIVLPQAIEFVKAAFGDIVETEVRPVRVNDLFG